MSDSISEVAGAGTLFGDETESSKKLSQRIKFAVFNFMATIIGEEIIKFPFRYIFYLLELVQMMALCFSSQVIGLWQSPNVVGYIGHILNYFNLAPLIIITNWSIFLLVYYLIISLIFGMVIIITYIHISTTRKTKKNGKNNHWSVYLFRIFSELLPVTIMPIFSMLFIPLKCFNSKGNITVLQDFEDVECFTGEHLVHFFIGILFLLIFFTITLGITMFAFEYRRKSLNTLAKFTSYGDIMFFLQKVGLLILFNFFQMAKFEIFLLVIYTVSAFGLYYIFNNNMYFYRKKLISLCSFQHLLIFWTGFVMLIAYVLQNTRFQGQLFLWISGLILLTLISIITEDFKLHLLYINTNKFENEHIAVVFLHYLNIMLNEVVTNKKVEFLLDCLTEYHKSYCLKPTCPSRQTYTKTKNLKLIFKEDYEDEYYIMLVYLVQSMYNYALDKYNFSPKLRIQLACFMHDNLKVKQQALQELMIADSCKPSIIDEFIIFYLKKNIEEEMMQTNQMGSGFHNSDLLDELTFHNLDKRIKSNIEKSTSLHLELWSLLSEDIPDLTRLTDTGSKIILLNNQIESDWMRVKTLNVSSLNRAYAKFLYFILQDNEEAFSILDRLRSNNFMTNKTQVLESQLGDISNDSSLRIFISAQEQNFGQITNLNSAAAAALCFTKNELLNTKVNSIMPAMYAKHHDKFIENYLSNFEEKSLSNERLVMAKTKTNYVIPLYLNIKHIPSIMNNLQFMATLKIEKIYKISAFLIIDQTDGIVQNISSGCINVIGLDEKKLLKGDLKISDIIPNFFENIKEINTKAGTMIETNIFTPEGTYESSLMRISAFDIAFKEFGHQGYIVKIEKLSSNQLSLAPGQQTSNQGQSYLESSHLETPNQIMYQLSSKSSRRKKNNELELQKRFFSLKYDIGLNKYMGEIINLENQPAEFLQSIERFNRINENILITQSEFDDSSRLAVHCQTENDESFVKYVKNPNPGESKILNRLEENMRKTLGISGVAATEENKGEKIDFGLGIRTMKLYNNRLYDPDDLKKEFLRESDEENSEGTPKEGAANQNPEKGAQLGNTADKDEEENEDEADDNSSLFKTRNKFKALIMKQNMKNFFPITRLNLGGLFVLAVLITIGIIYYAINIQQYNNVNKNYNILYNSNKMMGMSQGILNKLHELMNLNAGIYQNTLNTVETADALKAEIKSYVENLGNYQTYIQLNTFYLTSDHQKLFKSNSIPMYFQSNSTSSFINKDTTIIYFDLNAATQQIISKSLSIIDTDLGSITKDNSDVFFLTYNLLNEYANSLLLSTNYYSSELIDLLNSLELFVLVILIVSVFISLTSLAILSLFYFYVLVYINRILQVFLEIPINKAKNLFVKCELFLTNLQQGGDDDDLLDNDNVSNGEDDNENEEQSSYTTQSAATKKMKVRRKRYKANYKSLKIFIIEILIVIMFIETFFAMYYVQFQTVFDNQKQLQEELNNTLLMGPQFSFTNNAIRQYVLNSTAIISKQNSTAAIGQTIDSIYQIFSIMKKDHSENLKIFSDFYKNWFTNIMLNDVCPIFETLKANLFENCSTIGHSSFSQGLALMISHYLEETRRVFSAAQYLRTNHSATLKDLSLFEISITNPVSVSSNTVQNEVLNILQAPSSIEQNKILMDYLYLILDFLNLKFLDGINQDYNTQSSLFLIILITFIIFLIIVYLIFWISIVNSLYLKVTRVRNFLLLIPIDIIQGSKLIMEKLINILK